MARYEKDVQAQAYRVYVTDFLKQMGGADRRYYDIIHPKVEDDRTSEEVVEGIREKLRSMA